MQNLLEELYKTDLHLEKFHARKVYIDEKSYQIVGITQSGKSSIIKNYLLSLKKSSYLYIDCSDIRIDVNELNKILSTFCTTQKIDVLALDNYIPEITITNVSQLLISSEKRYDIDFLKTIQIYPLDYEEFLAYEHKYDSTALNHYFQLGGFPAMHKISTDNRNLYIQKMLTCKLDIIELNILVFCAKMMSQKISPYNIYERLKQTQKISKDKLYKSFDNLVSKRYIHLLSKINHPNAIKKIYLSDISLKSALSIDKNFSKLFENIVYLELLKSGMECFYDDDIDFYIPSRDELILCKPFADERRLFKKLENIEAFIFSYGITKVTAITINKEGKISHPFSKVEMIPFDIWALGD